MTCAWLCILNVSILGLGDDSAQRDRRVAGLTAAMEELKDLEDRLERSWD